MGQTSEVFGGASDDPSDRGEEKEIEIKLPEEYLTSVSGSYGVYKNVTVITSLTFTTNLNTYGFGTYFENTFFMPIGDNDVVGFYGTSGYYLDSLGIFVTPRYISIGPFGGNGGHPWSYRTDNGIKRVIINYGENIKSICFRDGAGYNSDVYGGENSDDTINTVDVTINWPSEYLISVSGTYGNWMGLETVTSLSVATNLYSYGPFRKANPEDKHFILPADGGKIIGFHGRAGECLDAIGIFVQPN